MNRYLQKNFSAFWFYGSVTISGLSLIVTFFHYQLSESSGILRLIRTFSLIGENNMGAWWSGVLLLLAAIHASDGYFLLIESKSRAARGWVLISIILLLLSADEISSIHERVGQLGQDFGIGTWWSLLPFAIILFTMLAYALLSLWSTKGHRRKMWFILLGFSFFGVAALLEFIEHAITRETDLARIMHFIMEEGSELLGMLILLRVSMSNTKGLFYPKSAKSYPTFESICLLRFPVFMIGLALALFLAFLTANLSDQNRGHPADWFAAALFLFAALAILRRFLKNGENIAWRGGVLDALCFLSSAGSVAIQPSHVSYISSIQISVRMLLLFLFSIFFCVVNVSNPVSPTRRHTPFFVVMGILALLLLYNVFQTSLLFLYGLTQYLALFVYYYANSSQNE